LGMWTKMHLSVSEIIAPKLWMFGVSKLPPHVIIHYACPGPQGQKRPADVIGNAVDVMQ